jgi:hypothetical protein
MIREVRNSSRVNTELLDRGLSASSSAGELYIKQGEAIADRVAAEGRGIENLGLAKKNFHTAYGAGLKIGLIAVGIGLSVMLILFGASYVIDALRRPYSAVAFETLAKENAALLERVQKLGVLISEPPAQAEPPFEESKSDEPTQNSEKATIGVSTAALTLDAGSTNCPENRSYTVQCAGSHRYDDGRTYAGQWRNGLPEGKGTFTMANGSVLEATWKAGFPLEVNNQPPAKKALTTVTVFKSLQNYDLVNGIMSIDVGHRFADGNSADWYSAYCYAYVESTDGLSSQVNLSTYETRGGPLVKADYANNLSSLISAANFRKAQEACPYQTTGFRD